MQFTGQQPEQQLLAHLVVGVGDQAQLEVDIQVRNGLHRGVELRQHGRFGQDETTA